ncbi:probable WRKY transcription factor 65 isoform X2 [Rhodamnia argentea]|uniref:Probable WRKY transcription factor 65 isoform X2 n=1 Tax=Rhodamnia argentea TaxID=178133 RepID=A0A8B8QN44_9MYRT|nr:probable WRKY transcription factor 65 isoform X2 [Rhodamnia argentea]
MYGSFNSGSFMTEHDDNGSSPENSIGESPPPSSRFGDTMKTGRAAPSPKRRRGVQKRVVSIPIKDTEGSRLKGEGAPPPSDSWAWRKYGQKPIKGSPYPRAYYRCSSSKGCPARKQVERSRDDPTMLLITYSCDHNHPWPAPKNSHHHHNHQNSAAAVASAVEDKPEMAANLPDPEAEPEPEPEEKFPDMSEESVLMSAADEFSWFMDMPTTSSTILESPIFAESGNNGPTTGKGAARDADVAMFFPMREEDESLFADLGELPECSVVFRHRRSGGLSTQVQIC